MDNTLNKIKKIIPKKLFRSLQPSYHFLLSWLAALLYGWPSEKLIIIGVTGTTGKTTSIYLIAKMLESAGYRVGYTSTAMFNNGKKEWLNDKKMTMVGRLFTQNIIRQMVKNKCQYAIIETTSEGIVQFRHRFINYDILIFTGLYEEHIDAHGSFENYKQAKGKLFEHLARCKTKYSDDQKYIHKTISGIRKIDLNRIKKTTIVNADDEQAEYFLEFGAEDKISFSRKDFEYSNTKLIKYSDVEVSEKGTSFVVNNTKIDLQLLGGFNVVNAMTAVCCGMAQGLTIEKIKQGLEKIKGVPGRFEKITSPQPSPSKGEGEKGVDTSATLSTGFTVIVDYAFEPKAVTKLYETIQLIPHKKVIHVLGSTGGGRDVARRPRLGKIAGEQANIVIVTNEDPYDDNPQIIIDQVAIGAEHVGKSEDPSASSGQSLFKILDRREAIKKALSLAKEGDIVLITGKGSEQAICVADGKKIKWDDREVVREELEGVKIN